MCVPGGASGHGLAALRPPRAARALQTASFVSADALAARDALGVFEAVLSGVLHDIDGGVVRDEALLGFPVAKRESSRGAFTLVTNVASH